MLFRSAGLQRLEWVEAKPFIDRRKDERIGHLEEGGLVFLSDEAGEVHAVGNATGTGACAHIWEKGGVPHGVGDAPSDDKVPPRSRVEARDGIDEGQHVLADVEST